MNRIPLSVFYFTLLLASGCCPIAPRSLLGLNASIGQAIIVHPVKNGSRQALLSAWQKNGTGWHCIDHVSAVIGKNGLAARGEKKEGDGKTPSGIYPLGPAFGYASSINTGLEYRKAGENDFWVDDVRSLQYNQWVNGMPEASSYEHMKRLDGLYRYGIVIGYNMHPVIPGDGSAIFMHIWRRYDSPTSGCVALNQRNLRKILQWLDRWSQPVIILE